MTITINLPFITIELNLLAVAIYLAAVYVGTRYLKPAMALHPVFLSWGISVPAFFAVWIFARQELTPGLVVQFAVLTLLLNGGLKVSHVLWDLLAANFSFVPLRRRGVE